MEFQQFEKILNEYKKSHQMISDLYDIGFDLMEGKFKLDETIYNLFFLSLETHYNEDGIDWISWFIFENEWGEKKFSDVPVYRTNQDGVMELVMDHPGHSATDGDGNPICYDIPSLWEFLEKDYKLIL